MTQDAKTDVVVSRYASPEMAETFSAERRIRLWRDLWVALAEAERELGLPIKKEQIDELKKFQDKINWDVAQKREKEIRHEIMAHVHAYGAQCKKAAGIIHLGATSAYVTDNSDLIMMRDGMKLIAGKLAAAIDRLGAFAAKEKDTATVAFTHFQPAQPTTVGKRACLWIQDFIMDLERLEYELKDLRLLGVKGATGTQDSFLKLFEGDKKKVRDLDKMVVKSMGFAKSYAVSGQTYPRKVDTRVVTMLAAIAESASKFATDIRLLQAMHEIEEPQEESQIGSSAMPYKQNPMRAERTCALSRYVMNLVGNVYGTASTQWFERTLDDSANRRLVIPQAFLVCDGVLNLVINIATGMRVRDAVIAQNLDRELPFLQTEEVLMHAVRAGGDRQALHEKIRVHAGAVVKEVREKGASNDLLARLRRDSSFSAVPPKVIIKGNVSRFVGLASQQTGRFLRDCVEPVRKRYKTAMRTRPEVRV